jgi:hypothetical protein
MSPTLPDGANLTAISRLRTQVGIDLRVHQTEIVAETDHGGVETDRDGQIERVSPGHRKHPFIASPWTGWSPTVSAKEFPDKQVRDAALLDARGEFIENFQPRRAPEFVLQAAAALDLPARYARQFKILEALGTSPFSRGQRTFQLRDDKGAPVRETQPDNCSNIGKQSLFSTCELHVLCPDLKQAGYLSDADMDLALAVAPYLKLFKLDEILDRKSSSAGLFKGEADAHERLAMHRDRYVAEGLLLESEADSAFRALSHTCGAEGFWPFIGLSEQGQATIDAHRGGRFVPLTLKDLRVKNASEMADANPRAMRALRAIDDITLSIGRDYGLSAPHNKILLLGKSRGEGLQGTFVVYDQASRALAALPWRDLLRENDQLDLSRFVTFGTAQDLISSTILCEMYHSLKEANVDFFHGGHTGEDRDLSPSQTIINQLNHKLEALQ